MRQPQSDKNNSLYKGTTITVAVIVVLFFLFSCTRSKGMAGSSTNSSDSISVISTYGVESLISDSGRISYKIIAEEWLMFEKLDSPFWAFEKGAYLEKYDDSLRIEATLKSDTAYFFSKAKIWQLIGNVKIRNQKDERFFTDMLFWDQDKKSIYSDSYIKIEQQEQITEGRGFSSNQELTQWQIHNTEGIYPIEE
ncbi:MAG: LPS export ABC transporter periplasmic protein LptC [Bacteroidaceae bacterium]|nr:LPS export ABC transporter periplasmic protein LptC [Bacteroidaceae bacterium]